MSRCSSFLYATSIILAGCANKPVQPSDKHIQQQADQPAAAIPQTVKHGGTLPPPKPGVKAETYSVVVTNVPAQEILFALARDAKINLDLHAGIQGMVTLNALNQTLPQILTRIARQIDMRYELDNGSLLVMPDFPFLHNYKIDYVNMMRDSESTMTTNAQVAAATTSGAMAIGGANNSSMSIKDISRNRFWETLTQNIKDILHETDRILPEGSSETVVQQLKAASSTGTGVQPANNKKHPPKGGIENSPNPVSVEEGGTTVTRRSTFREAASVIANPEAGLITVRATARQHEKIQGFIDQVMSNARRQVMIEATIVEVRLSDNYKQGINWSAMIKANGNQFKLVQSSAGLPTNVGNGMFGIITNPTASSINQQVSLLESFGNVKVLSSPKLSVLNNQTAIIKVVENLVYFTITGGTTIATSGGTTTTPTTSTPSILPVGFIMSVTPQISDTDVVLFNLRPSISRLVKMIPDPANTANNIPQTQTRELESVMRIENNQIAVMGGLMQDEVNNFTDAIPGLSSMPVAGELFKQHNDTTTKTELVIFLRPIVIKDASITGDFSAYRNMLPNQSFFKHSPGQEFSGEPVNGKL
ncbi:MAG: type II and III secretion system protein [Gallionellaceae bacterium]|nr:type II and III secretion system protein [Gallionellaceae bacterium]